MAAIKPVSYRTFDELLDECRLDFTSFNSAGDIDAALLIKVAQRINYELGLRIHSIKETMLEVDHHRAKLPADYHQALLTLVCHQWRHVQNAPWNGNVLLEELAPSVIPPPSTCPCWTVVSTGYQTTYVDCTGIEQATYFPPGTSTLCATSIDDVGGHGGSITISTDHFCYNDNVNGVYTCTPPDTCNICNVNHIGGNCPEVPVNPYPLGKTRTLCNDTVNIRILHYCSSEVRCYEHFERLYIEPHKTASAFSRQGQFKDGYHSGSISNGFLYVDNIECTKVYLYYLGAMEDDDGNLLVLDHPVINFYYQWAIKHQMLENLYLNGEDLIQRLQYAEQKMSEYREKALSIANMPDFRDCVKTIQLLRQNYNRNYYHPVSRYYGHLGWAFPVDTM